MKKTLRTLLLVMWILCLSFAIAIADPAAPAAAVQLDPLAQVAILAAGVFFAVLTPIAVALGRKYAARIVASTGVDLTADVEAAARMAVGLAEQMAMRKLNETKLVMPGGEKMALASKFFLEIAERKKWPEWVKDHAPSWIEAHLGARPKMLELATLETSDGTKATSAAVSK